MNILYTHYITHNSATRQVYPVNFSDGEFVWEGEDDSVFLRMGYSGKLLFVNKPNAYDDFDYFLGIEQGVNRCLEISYKVYKSCDNGSTYNIYWEGYFAINDGELDIDKCTYSIQPLIDDEYRCLIENKDQEINIGQTEDIYQTSAQLGITEYEFYKCVTTLAGAFTCTDTLPAPASEWLVFHQERVDDFDNNPAISDSYWNMIYYREIKTTACQGGLPVPPDGSGWVLKTNNCATTGLSVYVRTPVTVVSFNPNPEVASGDCDSTFDVGLDVLPPRRKRIKVNITATPTTPAIETAIDNAIQYYGGSSEYYTYQVENNSGSTYFWDSPTGFMTVISGQGTNKVVVSFSNTGTNVVRCTETPSCAGALTPVTKNITTYLCGDLSKPITGLLVKGPDTVCPTQSSVVYYILDPPQSFTTITWTVGTGGTIISGQGTSSIVVDFNTALTTVTVQCSLAGHPCVLGTGFSTSNIKTVNVNKIVKTPNIVGLTSICPSSSGAVYSVPTRSGATYTWEVTGGTITSGQSTGTINVSWGSAGTGYVKVKEVINCGCTWIKIAECAGAENKPPFYWCPDTAETDYTNGRRLQDVVNFILQSIGCSFNSEFKVTSDFFDWDAAAEAAGYFPEINYVTLAYNQLTHITIHKKADIIDPTTNPITGWNITMADLLEMFKSVFQVYWYIDSTGRFRLEHISFFQRTLGLDLTNATYRKYTQGTNKYSYEKLKMPKYERFKWSDQQNLDFIGAEISYIDSACANQNPRENVIETSLDLFTTDIKYIDDFPTEINDDGFVLIANNDSSATSTVRQDLGLMSNTILPNACLSWANLHYNYHRHNRVIISGKMNLINTNFISIRKSKKQIELQFPFCCDLELNTIDNYYTTDIGNGVCNGAKLSVRSNEMKMNLIYE